MELTAAPRDWASLDEWLDAQPTGSARVLFTDDVDAALALLADRARSGGGLVVASVGGIPSFELLERRLVEALADGALARWPSWYGGSFSATGAYDDELSAIGAIAHVVSAEPEVLERWLDRASALARRGSRPLFPDLHLGLQARQLALALGRDRLRIVIARLGPFARAAAWLAGQTGARVLAVLPDGDSADSV